METSNLLPLSHQALSVYAQLCKPVCRELEISQTAFDILMFLAEHPEYDTAKEITNHSGVKKNLVSVYVEKLVNLGYLERKNVPTDRRLIRLVLTAKAEPIIQKGYKAQQYYQNFLVKGLSEEELTTYKKCIDKITKNTKELADLLSQSDKEALV